MMTQWTCSHLSNHGVHSLPGRRGAETKDRQVTSQSAIAHGTLGRTEVWPGECSPRLALRAQPITSEHAMIRTIIIRRPDFNS